MQSYIKKSVPIREFRRLAKGKNKTVLRELDSLFFQILNRIYANKPYDIKFHITPQNSLVFNVDYPENVSLYFEQFFNTKIAGSYTTLLNLTKDDDPVHTLANDNLEESLDVVDNFMQNKEIE